MTTPYRHHLVGDYSREYGRDSSADTGTDFGSPANISYSPDWLIAVFQLGRPASWSRRTLKSMGTVAEGAFTRNTAPVLIASDCVDLRVQNSKAAPLKSLSAVLRGPDYRNIILGGDWVMAWMWDNAEDRIRIQKDLLAGKPCNKFMDGLKFVGRATNIRRSGSTDPNSGTKRSEYHLQATAFPELMTSLFYDAALAESSAVSGDMVKFMGRLLDFNELLKDAITSGAALKDNVDRLIDGMINIVLGKGPKENPNTSIQNATRAAGASQEKQSSLLVSPQFSAEAPAAYLVPRGVGLALGKTTSEASKDDRIFGYSDILDVVLGQQNWSVENGWQPDLDESRSVGNRKFCENRLKGTFLPVNLAFLNQTLWSVLTNYLNSWINEIYTVLRVNREGSVVPTLVVRQIALSTVAAVENPGFTLTRFHQMPRWVVDPTMVSQDDIGRSDSTRLNFIHIYGTALNFANNKDTANQIARNPPIFDTTDIQRSGIRAAMGTVDCGLQDVISEDEQRKWLSAIADWSFGSHLTFNGTVQLSGIQAPIAEGDNAEIDGMVYRIEAVHHHCGVEYHGTRAVKTFRTSLELSNGMPADQSGATSDLPVYPGFINTAEGGVDLSDEDLNEMSASGGTAPSDTSDTSVGFKEKPMESTEPGRGGT